MNQDLVYGSIARLLLFEQLRTQSVGLPILSTSVSFESTDGTGSLTCTESSVE
jgi:hypothetical protein